MSMHTPIPAWEIDLQSVFYCINISNNELRVTIFENIVMSEHRHQEEVDRNHKAFKKTLLN